MGSALIITTKLDVDAYFKVSIVRTDSVDVDRNRDGHVGRDVGCGDGRGGAEVIKWRLGKARFT